jgi:hypothetical protein
MEGLRKLGEPEDARFRLHNVARLGLGRVALAPRGCKCTATAQDSIDHRSGMQAGFARGSSFLEIGEWNMLTRSLFLPQPKKVCAVPVTSNL